MRVVFAVYRCRVCVASSDDILILAVCVCVWMCVCLVSKSCGLPSGLEAADSLIFQSSDK